MPWGISNELDTGRFMNYHLPRFQSVFSINKLKQFSQPDMNTFTQLWLVKSHMDSIDFDSSRDISQIICKCFFLCEKYRHWWCFDGFWWQLAEFYCFCLPCLIWPRTENYFLNLFFHAIFLCNVWALPFLLSMKNKRKLKNSKNENS